MLGTGAHRAELDAECRRVLRFAAASRHPDGGFAWLDERGRPQFDRPVEGYVTARMTHVFAIGTLLGLPGQDELVAHGVAALRDLLHDREYGGWYAAVRPTDSGKKAYEHAFVLLAASSAAVVGAGGTLLADALGVQQRHFWREDDGMVVEEWDRPWRTLDRYRGANANMHTVEAYLAAADAGADPVWRERALRITERIVHRVARQSGWLLPEHYDPGWTPLPEFNRDRPADQFRPYGVTIGHLIEWSRLALDVRAALGPAAPDWLLPDAAAMFDRAIELGWAVDGADALHQVTGADRYATGYDRTWDYATRCLVDPDGGSWWHELDPTNRPSATVWPGKPDAYHVVQALLLPRLPLAPTIVPALARGLLDSPG